METILSVQGICKSFGIHRVLDHIDIDILKGEFLCLLGPSGCGKTTLLRVIAGLECPDNGRVMRDGANITFMEPSKRGFGIVFQSYALFPNLTAIQNAGYGVKGKGAGKKAAEALALVGLSHESGKYPAQLSGGQQQRVALARALAVSPDILLLDEPLSALDAKVRAKLRADIRALQRELGITTIMVTHDQEEALTMSDRIALMDNGIIVQTGSPQDVYDRPVNSFAADFIGMINFMPDAEPTPGIRHMSAIRPEHIHVFSDNSAGRIGVQVRNWEFRGSFYRLYLEPETRNGFPILAADVSPNIMKTLSPSANQKLYLEMPDERILSYRDGSLT